MTAIPKWIDPDASGDGSGDSEANAYTSMSAAEADLDGTDHSANDITITCLASSNTADSTSHHWAGFVGDPQSIIISAKVGEEAVTTGIDVTRYRHIVNSSSRSIYVDDFAMDFISLQIGNIGASAALSCASDVGTSKFENCYFSVDSGGLCCGIDGNGDWNFYSCIFFQNGSLGGEGAKYAGTGTVNFLNVVSYNFDDGLERDAGTVICTNCAVFGNNDDFDGTMTITFCASDDGDGTDSVDAPTWADVFEDFANGDFSLKTTDTDLTGAGDDLSGTFTTSMNGITRAAPFDIGAFAVAADAPFLPFYSRRNNVLLRM